MAAGGAFLLTAYIVVELTSGSDTAAELLALSWGRISVADLYLGLALAGAWVWFRETRVGVRLLWLLAFVFLGNVAVGAYIARAGWNSTWLEFFAGKDPRRLDSAA